MFQTSAKTASDHTNGSAQQPPSYPLVLRHLDPVPLVDLRVKGLVHPFTPSCAAAPGYAGDPGRGGVIHPPAQS